MISFLRRGAFAYLCFNDFRAFLNLHYKRHKLSCHVLKISYFTRSPHKFWPINEKKIIQLCTIRPVREKSIESIFVRNQPKVYPCSRCFKYYISFYLWQDSQTDSIPFCYSRKWLSERLRNVLIGIHLGRLPVIDLTLPMQKLYIRKRSSLKWECVLKNRN